MDSNLISLALKLKSDPLTYKDDFSSQLATLQSLLELQNPPLRQIQPMIFFVAQYCTIDESSIKLLIKALDVVQEYKTKKVILNGLILIRQKGLIESRELLRLIIMHGNDPRYFQGRMEGFLDEGCVGVLMEWYSKGTERQKVFCYYMILVLFTRCGSQCDGGRCTDNRCADGENCTGNRCTDDGINYKKLESIVCDALFTTGKLSKTCCLYFLNRTELEFDISKITKIEEYSRKLYRELKGEAMDRDLKIMKLRICIRFKKYIASKNSNTSKYNMSFLEIIMKMIDLENEDVKILLECLVDSISIEESEQAVDAVYKSFVEEGKSDEVVVLGMNVMREIYSKFQHNVRYDCDDDSCIDDCDDDDSCIDDYDSNRDQNMIKPHTNNNPNLMKSLASKILKLTEQFKGIKSKAIFYAYKLILKVIVDNEPVDRHVSHIKAKASKEQMKLKREKGREEMKRLREEVKREKKQEKYKNKKKGRKRRVMSNYLRKK